VVTLPLLVALITALVAVDRLTSQGRQTILAATHLTKGSRMMLEDITAMERHMRQFQVLKDPALYHAYLERHEELQKTLQELARQDIAVPLRSELGQLRQNEQALFEALRDTPPESWQTTHTLDGFLTLGVLARSVLWESSQLVGGAAEDMQRDAAHAQQLLLWLALLLIALALLLAAVFTVLTTRPIKQLDRAIRQLGDGALTAPIQVRGPKDLTNLGDRLDWLRLRLIQLEQQKTNFLRHMSHEFKTPLASIREGAGLLEDRVLGWLTDEQTEVVRILQQNSLQLQRLIEGLIHFGSTGRPTPITKPRPVALHRLLAQLAQDQKLAVKAKQIRLQLDVVDAVVVGDPEKLRSVFDNLLSNAIKFAPPRGSVAVRLSCRDGRTEVDVRDDGPGIAPDEREKVFAAFYQGRAVAQGHVKGSGLGLSIAREYVKSHDGHIEILDTGRGAHLRVTLPLASYPQIPNRPSHEPRETVRA
jgi:two-component system, NtrC family, sensor histidine kinase GlrK